MEASIIIAVVSLTVAGISLFFSFLKFGINITQEFTEKPDVLERKEKVEEALRTRLRKEWESLIQKHEEKSVLKEEAIEEFYTFGITAYVCTLPSLILEEISGTTKSMISSFVYVLISLVSVAVGYVLNENPLPLITTQQQAIIILFLIVFSFILGYDSLKTMKNRIPANIELRQKFFTLSENTTLETALEIWTELNEKDLL